MPLGQAPPHPVEGVPFPQIHPYMIQAPTCVMPGLQLWASHSQDIMSKIVWALRNLY